MLNDFGGLFGGFLSEGLLNDVPVEWSDTPERLYERALGVGTINVGTRGAELTAQQQCGQHQYANHEQAGDPPEFATWSRRATRDVDERADKQLKGGLVDEPHKEVVHPSLTIGRGGLYSTSTLLWTLPVTAHELYH